MSRLPKFVVLLILLGCTQTHASRTVSSPPQEDVPIRVATYNIKYLKANVGTQGDRQEKLRRVIANLDAHVVALQEIDDRAALEAVFDRNEWQLVIDNESNNDQDVALAIRAPLRIRNFPADLDADDQHFLFPAAGENDYFPNRRDVLVVELEAPTAGISFHVMVIHAKSRYGGRTVTDPRREEAARRLVRALDTRFHEANYVLLGDFNDTPDDRSLNILETGSPDAVAGTEEIDGPFLSNLTERLWARDHVTWGLTSTAINGDLVNTVNPGARQRNNDLRGTDQPTGRIMFDNILIPRPMRRFYVADSCHVFDRADAVRGNDTTRASDHVPVYADFVLVSAPAAPPAAATGEVRIVGLLPDPDGEDSGREQVTLSNGTAADVPLAGWTLRDRAGNTYALSGTLTASQRLVITMTTFSMPLNNSGDSVTLIDNAGGQRHQVSYEATQVQRGVTITFP